jgi:tRNA threonylcarbamoyladenosine biosynthesis protein TsaB
LILILESSASWCSVSLADLQGNSIEFLLEKVSNSHAEKLPVFAHQILSKYGEEVRAVAVSSGPGSYTGLRIGSSLAKGICYAKNIPLISVSALRGMAHQLQKNIAADDVIISHLDARRDEVYMQLFHANGTEITQVRPCILTHGIFDSYLQNTVHIVGDCPSKFAELCAFPGPVVYHECMPQSDFLAAEAAEKYAKKDVESTAYFEPKYLKEYQPGAHKKFTV